jgi:hypothetical protein
MERRIVGCQHKSPAKEKQASESGKLHSILREQAKNCHFYPVNAHYIAQV